MEDEIGNQHLTTVNGSDAYRLHQDWEGTERARTDASSYQSSSPDASFYSLPYGDAQAEVDGGSVGDLDAYHYGMLDSDMETGTDHAQFRQYSSATGRWMRPDPYSGSYDMSNPQSMNRYVYAMNSPLSYIDPSGLQQQGGPVGPSEGGFYLSAGFGGGYGFAGDGNFGSYGAPAGSSSSSGTVYQSSWEVYIPHYYPDGNGGFTQDGGSWQLETSYLWISYPSLSGVFLQSGGSSGGGGGAGAGKGAPTSKQVKCLEQALKKNGIALGLDAAGDAAAFLPGGGLAVAGVQMGIAVASTVNSAAHKEVKGSMAGIAGFQLAPLAPAAKYAGLTSLAKTVPFLGGVASGFATVNDLAHAYADYQSCIVKN